MSFDNTRTVKENKFGDISVAIEGGVYYPDGDGYCTWEYWVEVVHWDKEDRSGKVIHKSNTKYGDESIKELEPEFARLCNKYKGG